MSQTSLAAVQTLGALLALADIAVGEAALDLADQLDAKAEADQALRQHESGLRDLHGMHERLSQPGQALQPALMNQIAQQAMDSLNSCQAAQAHCAEVDAQLDDKRGVLHALQSRHEMIQGLHQEARDAQRAEREHREALAREELYLSHRWSQGGRRWM